MGYDITFHPISAKDIQRFLFDVIDRPERARDRSAELSPDPATRRLLLDMYSTLFQSLSEPSKLSKASQSETLNMVAAQIAGLRHPYWYARHSWIGRLDDLGIDTLFAPLSELDGAPASLREMRQETKIFLNCSASGVIRDLDALLHHLERLGLDDAQEPSLFKVFDGARLASLREAIAYADERGLYLIEAADVVVPAISQNTTDPHNFRQASRFDPPKTGVRRWFDQPVKSKQGAYVALMTCPRPLRNDQVEVRRILRQSRPGLVVPQYHLQKPEFRKYFQSPNHVAVMDETGTILPVHTRSLRILERAQSHKEYHRRTFEYEREYYEEKAREDHMCQSSTSGHMLDFVLSTGMLLAHAGEPELARLNYQKLLCSANDVLERKHFEGEATSVAGDRPYALRAKWFAEALLGRQPPVSELEPIASLYFDYAKSLPRADWDEIMAKNYVDFALTALLCRAPALGLEMLTIDRPLEDQAEVVLACRALAEDGIENPDVLQTCANLLDVMRHPAGGDFLKFKELSGVQLALLAVPKLASGADWLNVADAVDWMGR